jgi:hypothetical protein
MTNQNTERLEFEGYFSKLKEFMDTKLDYDVCHKEDVFNWHISQLKSLREEIKKERFVGSTDYGEGYNEALSDVLALLDRFIK